MTTTEILTGIKDWVLSKLSLKQDVINDLAAIRSGSQAGSTAVQPSDLSSYFNDASYDTNTHRINFYHGQNIVAYVDASPFIVDGMVDDVRIENGYLVIDFNTDSGKQDISIPLTDIFDPSNYYNKTQTDTLLGNKVDKVSGKGLSTNDYTNAEKEKLSGLQNYDDTQVRQLITQTNANFANYYTKAESYSAAEVDEALGGKQNTINDLGAIRSGASAGATAVQPDTLNSALSNTVAESGVYDVTANNNNAKFASLSALLSSENLNTLIPTDIRKGGMSIKFVQSSDNNYVQFRLKADEFSIDVEDWEQAASVAQLEELEDNVVMTGSYDATVAVGLADNLRGDTVVNAEFYKRKTGGTQSVGSGIAAIKEVRGKSLVWNQLLKEGILVDMGLPSGTLWASCNIDITQPDGFAASPFQYECSYFSWGNVDGHNPVGNAFDYDWGGVNQAEPWYEGQPYGETDGNTLTGNIPVGEAFDAARANLGAPWRMPTSVEFKELFGNSKFIDANGDEIASSVKDKRVTVNGVQGLYLESTINGARLFFSCSGYGNGSSLSDRWSLGSYWASNFIRTVKEAARLLFYGNTIYPNWYGNRNLGLPVRPVLTHKLTPETDGKGHKFIQYGDNITNLTLMYGTGNEPSSVEDFVKLYPLNRYTYNEGEVIPFAAQNLVTIGKNQYNPATGKANLLGGQTYQIGGTFTGATIDEVAVTLDNNNCFTTTKDCVLDITGGNDTDTFVGLYNGETNTFEPYEKHTLPLDPSQWRDKQSGNLVFPYGGMFGYGTAYDYAKVDADGYIRKAMRVYERRAREIGEVTDGNIITDGRTYTFYPLAEPIEVELATPVYAKYLVDKDGTEEITPANGAAPYTTMANLSILYAMDARGEIKNLPKNYLSKESTENMLNAMVSAGVIASYTMTWDASNGRYAFVIQKNSEQ